MSNARLLFGFGGLMLAAFVYGMSPLWSVAIVVLTAVLFIFLVRWHNRLRECLGRHQRWLAIKRAHLARMTLDWMHIPKPPAIELDPDHPFAIDLDVVGDESLHRLLNGSSSLQGSEHLLFMLLNPLQNADAIRQRQQLIDELSPRFCDRLALYGGGGAVGERYRDTQRILDALEASNIQHIPGRFVALLGGLCVMTTVLWLLNQLGMLPPLYTLTFLAYIVLSFTKAKAARGLWSLAMGQHDIYFALSSVLSYLERAHTTGKPNLRALLKPFQGSDRPSRLLRKLLGVIAAGGLQANPIIWITVNTLLPWDLYHAWRLNVVRREYLEKLPGWLSIWHELEALAALRIFKHLNPEYAQPTIPTSGGMAATALGHPLIDPDVRVCNNFQLAELGRVVLITGSNMSGKSAFLRTLGINLVLAQAGGVVCAQAFSTQRFRIFSCIRISDSLAEGYSYFYAEVRRLRQILDALNATNDLPLFYLIDEIFKGTNNRERLQGSRAYIQALMNKHGMGLITTHDLELASIAGLLKYHFTDSVADDGLAFDYQLRLGVSPSTNALRIMAREGLPTE
jgi:hypothetical protein